MLDEFDALRTEFVVVGHRVADTPTNATPIRHTRDWCLASAAHALAA